MRKLYLINVYRKKEKVKKYVEALKEIFDGEIKVVLEKEIPAIEGPSIITGSEKMVGQGEVSDVLLEFISEAKYPILGICYGFQALAKSFGHRVFRCKRKHEGREKILKLEETPLLKGFGREFFMEESHRECVSKDGDLIVKAVSYHPEEVVEILQHPEKPLFGTQFHPERTADGKKIISNFISLFLR